MDTQCFIGRTCVWKSLNEIQLRERKGFSEFCEIVPEWFRRIALDDWGKNHKQIVLQTCWVLLLDEVYVDWKTLQKLFFLFFFSIMYTLSCLKLSYLFNFSFLSESVALTLIYLAKRSFTLVNYRFTKKFYFHIGYKF